MKINLLGECEIEGSLNIYEKNLMRDLKLEKLLEVMSEGNNYLYNICEKILVRPLYKEKEILRRQGIMQDAINFPCFFKALYQITRTAVEETSTYRKFTEPKYYQIVPAPKKIITEIEITRILMRLLRQIINTLNETDLNFISEALQEFKQDMNQNFNDTYFEEVEAYIKEVNGIKENEKIIISDQLKLGLSNKEGILNGILAEKTFLEKGSKSSLLNRLFNKEEKSNLTEDIILIDNTILANNKQELVEASLNSVFRLLSRFNRSLLGFLEKIRLQFGFFSACSRLYSKLKVQGIALCMPKIIKDKNIFETSGLIDLGLALKEGNKPIANTMSIKNKNLWIIIGANQGGKTTFLRSVGIATLMAQCGLFVGARSYCTTIYKGIYTHFPDEEDGNLGSGLLEQELNKLYEKNLEDIIFYRAIRNEKGIRSYQLEEGEPLKTSYGMDLYLDIISLRKRYTKLK